MFAVSQRIIVIGGANTDIVGRASAPLVAADSNPGHISRSSGGVARNVAENLALLGAPTALLTAFGDDASARELADECRSAGIDIALSLAVAGVVGSTYLAILDDSGDMVLAVNDMRALEALTPRVITDRAAALNDASAVVIDANLPEETLAVIAEVVRVPILLDPVSVAKAPRTIAIVPRLACVKCNAAEARALLEHDLDDPALTAEDLARALHARGAAAAIVSDGPRGTAFASADGSGSRPAPQVTIVNATGAGDAFTAGVAYALSAGRTVDQAVELGHELAACALNSEATVSPNVGPQIAEDAMRRWDT